MISSGGEVLDGDEILAGPDDGLGGGAVEAAGVLVYASCLVHPDGVRDLVDALEPDVNALREGGGKIFADVIGADRQFAVAAVDEDGELDARGPAEGGDGIHGGAAGAAGEEDIVREDERALLEVRRQMGDGDEGKAGPDADVVAMHRDIDDAEVRADLLEGLDVRGDAAGDLDAARGDADDADAGEIGIALDDLVRDAPQGAVDGLRVQDEDWRRARGGRGSGGSWSPSRPRGIALKEMMERL